MNNLESELNAVAEKTLNKLREAVLDRIYLVLIFVAAIGFAAGSIDPIRDGDWILVILYWILYGLILFTYLRKKMPIFFRTFIFMISLMVFGFSEIWFFGFASLGFLFLYGAITMACWLIGIRWGLIFMVITGAAVFCIAYVYSIGVLDMSSLQRQISKEFISWLGPTMGYFAITIATIFFIGVFINGLRKSIIDNIGYQSDLEKSYADLENTVTLLDTIIESLPGIFFMYELPPKYLVRYNENHWKSLGYTEEEIRRKTPEDFFQGKKIIEKVNELISNFKINESVKMELPLSLKDGTQKPYFFTAKAFELDHKHYFAGFAFDTTDSKELEHKFEQIFENANVGICLFDREGCIKDANPFLCSLSGMTASELIGEHVSTFFPSEEIEARMEKIMNMFDGKVQVIREEWNYELPRNRAVVADTTLGLIPFSSEGPQAVAVLVDVTEKKKTAELLSASLTEKEILLKELHHRVKNNLQLIASLTELDWFEGKNMQQFSRSTFARIESMAIIHQQLTEEPGYTSVNLEIYFSDFLDNIFRLYEIDQKNITVNLDVVKEIEIKPGIASHIGLMINEIVTNAVTHAFDRGPGVLKISASKRGSNLRIVVKDDGKGLPAKHRKKDFGGFTIVETLATQLGAEVKIDTGFLPNGRGTEFCIDIPIEWSNQTLLY